MYDFGLERTLDDKVLLAKLKTALERKQKRGLELTVHNTDRTFGTMFGAEITRRYPEGLAEDTFRVRCCGSGGQSFGAFIPAGLTLELSGDSNDYFGKGLSGGKLIVYPPKEAFVPGGREHYHRQCGVVRRDEREGLHHGLPRERFCIRNSGATAVVEGVGDHGCEYMTGGSAVILGRPAKTLPPA